MKKEKADRKISVRLNDEANKKVIDAVNKGISKHRCTRGTNKIK
jgi:hypothetical protein